MSTTSARSGTWHRHAAAVVVVVLAALAVACQEPTQIVLLLTTDIPCQRVVDIGIAARSLSQDAEQAPFSAVVSTCRDGNIGSMVVVPAGPDDKPIAVRVVAGIDRSSAACVEQGGCVTARRSLSFLPHRTLTVPIHLVTACIGNTCDASTTCVDAGRCALAKLDPASCVDGPCQVHASEDAAAPGEASGTSLEVSELATGFAHACARFPHGRVKCWGLNNAGQLGLGDLRDRGTAPGDMGDALPYVDLGAGRTALQLAAGANHTCALLDDATVKCWGRNAFGELGSGSLVSRGTNPNEMGDNLPRVELPRPARSIVAGESHTCALLDDGRLVCWGSNDSGQIGLATGNANASSQIGDEPGELAANASGVNLGSGRTARSVAAGFAHTCALLDDGTVKCWGKNSEGELGLGDALSRGAGPNQMGDALPRVDVGREPVRALLARGERTCVLADVGPGRRPKCWGANASGQLGLGDSRSRGARVNEMGGALPFPDVGGPRLVEGLAMSGTHTCILRSDGAVICWGYNLSGELGTGNRRTIGTSAPQMGDALAAVKLPSGAVRDVHVGERFSCAVFLSGRVACWGDNLRGSLGLGDSIDRGGSADDLGPALPLVDLGGLR